VLCLHQPTDWMMWRGLDLYDYDYDISVPQKMAGLSFQALSHDRDDIQKPTSQVQLRHR